jgi:hypothetical protein
MTGRSTSTVGDPCRHQIAEVAPRSPARTQAGRQNPSPVKTPSPGTFIIGAALCFAIFSWFPMVGNS